MLLHKLALAAGVSCVLSATLLPAQDSTPRRAGASRAGQRGSGDAFSFGVPGMGTSLTISLTNIAKVQEELGLTAEQKQQLDDLRKTTADKQRELIAELQKRTAELNQQVETAARKLLDEKQGARMEQLRLQREGVSALDRPEIAEKLGLNPAQRETLTKLAQAYRRISPFMNTFDGRAGAAPADQGAGTPPVGRGFRGGNAPDRQTRDQVAGEMIAVLTPEQKTKWDELQGVKFDFPVTPSQGRGAGISAIDFQIRSRSRPFELGKYPVDTEANARGLRLSTTLLGPAGPFRYPSILEALGLSEEQKTQIQTIGAEDVKAIEQIGPSQGTDVSAKIQEINKTTQEKLDKVLTDDQKAKLKELASRQPSTRP